MFANRSRPYRAVRGIVVAVLLAPVLAGAVPPRMPTEGVLRDVAGNPAPDGTYTAVFALYAAENDGDSLWMESQKLQVANGSFHAELGSVAPLEPILFADGKERWLELAIEGDPPLPRWPVGTAVYAFHAAGAAVANALQCTGCIPLDALAPDTITALTYTSGMALNAVQEAGYVTAAELSGYATLADLAEYVKTTQLASVAISGNYADLSGGPDLAAVAVSGSYADLIGAPDLNALNAATLGGHAPNNTGTPIQNSVPVTGADGKIPVALLPADMPGGDPDLNNDLLTSTFSVAVCSGDPPATANGTGADVGVASATLALAGAGEVLSASASIEVSHSDLGSPTLTLSVSGPGAVVVDIDKPDASGVWEIDLSDSLAGAESMGEWILDVTDVGKNDGYATIVSWCLDLEYLSSDTVEVKGQLITPVGGIHDTTSFMLGNMLSYALDGADVTSQHNLVVGLDAGYRTFMESQGDALVAMDLSNVYFVAVEAKNWPCSGKCIQTGPNAWIQYEAGATYEEARARLVSTVYAEAESSPAGAAVGLAAIRTAEERDIGRRAYIASVAISGNGTAHASSTLTGTFSNTFDNVGCSSWAEGSANKNKYANFSKVYWEMDTGGWDTLLEISAPSGSGGSSDSQFGDDTTPNETDNPTAVRLQGVLFGQSSTGSAWFRSASGKALVFCSSDVAWAHTGTGSHSIYDFSSQGIPDMSASSWDALSVGFLTSPVELSGTERYGIIKLDKQLVPGNTITLQASFDDGEHWTDVTEGEVFRVAHPGSAAIFRVTIQRQTPAQQSQVKQYAFYYW